MKNRLSTLRSQAMLALATSIFVAAGCGSEAEHGAELNEARGALTAPAWQSGTRYAAGDLASHDGSVYRCIQGHTSATGWEPTNVPALWALEGTDEPADPDAPTSPPPTGVTFDYLTLEADCDANPSSCCQVGTTITTLTGGDDTYASQAAQQCLLTLAGRDTIFLQSAGPSSLLLGTGDDVAMDGASDDLIWAGPGNDTIHGYGGTNLFFAGFGDDTIMAANGDNQVVPGPGADNVALGTGNDTVHIFDVCEVAAGERIDGGTGKDVIHLPAPVEEIRARGVQITNFESYVVDPQPCRSQCADPRSCDQCPFDPAKKEPGDCGCNRPETDTDGDGTPDCLDECKRDPLKTLRGVCDCHFADTDSDGDGLPNCVDKSQDDPTGTIDGICSEPGATAGTPCTDGVCGGEQTCTGARQCGDPNVCAPLPTGCRILPFRDRIYWFCSAPRGFVDAQALCRNMPGRYLTDLGNPYEAAFVAFNVPESAWTGGHDRGENGLYRWSAYAKDAGPRFWNGGPDGVPYNERFARWAAAEPAPASEDCVSIGADGRLRADACSKAQAFVCESPRRAGGGGFFDPAPISDTDGTDGKDDHDDVNCVDEGLLFDAFPVGEELEQQFEACVTDCAGNADCEARCAEPTAFNTAGGQCSAACPTEADRNRQACRDACTGSLAVPTGNLCDDEDVAVTFRTIPDAPSCTTAATCPFVPVPNDPSGLVQTERVCMVVGPQHDRRECQMRDSYPANVGHNRHGHDNTFPTAYCDEVSLCGPGLAPAETITSPNEHGGDLSEEELDPETFLGPAEVETRVDPFIAGETEPCGGSACQERQNHRWCHYGVTDTVEPRDPEIPQKSGGAGEAIKFDFSPSFDLYFGGADGQENRPFGAFGLPNAKVTTGASVQASVAVAIPGVRAVGPMNVVDARAHLEAGIHAQKCGLTTLLGAKVFGIDFVPADENTRNWPDADKQTRCTDAIEAVQTSVNRVKKAYHDALELVRQYGEAVADDDPADPSTALNNFSRDLCEQLFQGQDPPAGFLESEGETICNGERPETTINRFIRFYARTISGQGLPRTGLEEAVQKFGSVFADPDWSKTEIPIYRFGPNVERHTIFNQQFFIGPVPVNLEAYVSTNYGLNVTANVAYSPAKVMELIITSPQDQSAEDVIYVGAVARPEAGVAFGMFAGVGFSVNGFTTKLGIQGDLSLGTVAVQGDLGAGLGLAAVEDERDLPTDVAAILPAGMTHEDTLITTKALSPQLKFRAGLTLKLRNILHGSLSAKLKIKIAFFSKSWSKRLLTFNGICPGSVDDVIETPDFCDIPLIHAEGSTMPAASDLLKWGTIRMPAPFAIIPELPESGMLPPDPAPGATSGRRVDVTHAEKFFYDSLCHCAATPQGDQEDVIPDDPEDGCFRDADCCDQAQGAYCFKNPYDGRDWGVCTFNHRTCGEVCSVTSDCATYFSTHGEPTQVLTCHNHRCLEEDPLSDDGWGCPDPVP